MKKATKQTVRGSIHLYGVQSCGYGWIAQTADGRMLGDGKPLAGRSGTDAIWLAARVLQDTLGDSKGMVEVHYDFPQGPRMAVVPLAHVPYFGELPWGPGRVHVIAAEEILKHGEE